MSRPFWRTASKILVGLLAVLLGIAVIAGQVLDVMNDGLTWQKVVQWTIGGAVTYGLYRFYRHGHDMRSKYHDRWDQLFDREASA